MPVARPGGQPSWDQAGLRRAAPPLPAARPHRQPRSAGEERATGEYLPAARLDGGPTTWANETGWAGGPAADWDEDEYAGPPPRHLVRARPKQRASWREDLVTGYCGAALGLGLVVEGWGTLKLPATNAFLSPWHLLLGAGFVATALWLGTRHQLRRAWSRAAIPPGYELGLVGVALALLALAGDAAWHVASGPAAGMVRIMAPSRLLLLLGTGLLVTSGYRAAWAGPSRARGLSLRAFTPILVPLIVATTLGGFAVQYANPYVAWKRPAFGQFPLGSPEWTAVAIAALFTVLATTLLLLAPVLLTLRRWQPPFGAVTILFGAVGVLSSALTELALIGVVGAAVAGGLAADLLIRRWPPGPDHPGHLRLIALATPTAYWLAYFTVMAALYHQTWHASMVVGGLALAALTGYLLAVLVQPAAAPLAAWDQPADAGHEDAAEEATRRR